MKMKSVVLLAVALGCGLVAMLGVQQVMSSGTQPADQSAPETKTVLVASENIQPFSLLDDSNTTFKELPIAIVPEGAITSRSEIAESRLRYFALEGEVIQVAKLAAKNYAPSDEIEPGMRVVTVKVNQTKTHSGLIRPGDFVDVVLTYKTAKTGRRSRQRTVTVLKKVKIFSIDDKRLSNSRDADGNDLKAKNISLIVKPKHGNLLMLAESRGTLTLALRSKPVKGETDETEKDDGGFAVDDTVFDDLDQPAQSDTGPKVAQTKKTSTFQRFLTSGGNGQNSGDKPGYNQNSNDGRQEKPKWKMTIYEGTTPRIEEIELPETATGKEKSSKNDQNG